MFQRKRIHISLVFSLIMLQFGLTSAHAWNSRGHRLIAWMAFEQLDEETRNRIANILKAHPAEEIWWKDARFNPRDARLSLFVNASVFPDQARPDTEFAKDFRPRAHYINYRLICEPNQKPRLEPPLATDENIVNTYFSHLKSTKDQKNDLKKRAVALSWIIHQVGDIHQPLHATARFCPATPQGDRGGNDVEFPNMNGSQNLHAFWDGVLGREDNPASLDRESRRLLREYPREKLQKDLDASGNMNEWVSESALICKDVVYANLDINEKRFRELPVGYLADARKISEKRVVLAAYRLSEVLKEIAASR